MTVIEWILLGLFGLAVANSLAGYFGVSGFLSRRPAIGSETDLDEFKGMVRRQMYQALAQMAVLISAILTGIWGLASGQAGLWLVLGLNLLIMALGKLMTGQETKARSLPVLVPELAGPYQAVCETWVKKPFPDF
jgi:hypothetical protein